MSLLISKVLGTIFFTILVYVAGKFRFVEKTWSRFGPKWGR